MFQLISHRTEEALTVRIDRDRLLRELHEPFYVGNRATHQHWWPERALGAYGRTTFNVTHWNL
jgi:hypothetical protein